MKLHLCLVCSVPSQLDHFAARLTTSMLTLADAAASVGVDPLTLSDTASAKQDGGPFGFLAAFFEKLLKVGLLQRLWSHLCTASIDHCSSPCLLLSISVHAKLTRHP